MSQGSKWDWEGVADESEDRGVLACGSESVVMKWLVFCVDQYCLVFWGGLAGLCAVAVCLRCRIGRWLSFWIGVKVSSDMVKKIASC